jgi:hypothetical protein
MRAFFIEPHVPTVRLNDRTALRWKIDERKAQPAACMEVAAMTGPAAGFRRSRRAWKPEAIDARYEHRAVA